MSARARTCPDCGGRWWEEICPACRSWGVVYVDDQDDEAAPWPAPLPWLIELGREISVRNLGG